MSHPTVLNAVPLQNISDHPAHAQVVLVTPELALEWLKHNKVNRPIRASRVSFFQKIIAAGQFVMTGEGVQFEGSFAAGDMTLVNGQHRLTAISKGTTAVLLLVVENVDSGSQVFMDSGAKRSFGDVLKMERGVRDPSGIAAVVRLGYYLQHTKGAGLASGGGAATQSNADLLAWFDAHNGDGNGENEVYAALIQARRIRRQYSSNDPAFTLAWMWFSHLDISDANNYFDTLVLAGERSIGLEAGDPLLALATWLTNASQKRPRPRAIIQLAIAVKAWNMMRSGAEVKQMKWTPYGTGAESFPKPI